MSRMRKGNSYNSLKLSKKLAYILRHNPQKFGLKVNKYGWACLEDVAKLLKCSIEYLKDFINHQKKQRFEIRGDKIRALYGHSIVVELEELPQKPPSILYHGTPRKNVSKILKEGLKPMGRQFVHLSTSIEDALSVGKRKDIAPSLLVINSKRASEDKIKFYKKGEVWLVKYVPPEYIKIF